MAADRSSCRRLLPARRRDAENFAFRSRERDQDDIVLILPKAVCPLEARRPITRNGTLFTCMVAPIGFSFGPKS